MYRRLLFHQRQWNNTARKHQNTCASTPNAVRPRDQQKCVIGVACTPHVNRPIGQLVCWLTRVEGRTAGWLAVWPNSWQTSELDCWLLPVMGIRRMLACHTKLQTDMCLLDLAAVVFFAKHRSYAPRRVALTVGVRRMLGNVTELQHRDTCARARITLRSRFLQASLLRVLCREVVILKTW